MTQLGLLFPISLIFLSMSACHVEAVPPQDPWTITGVQDGGAGTLKRCDYQVSIPEGSEYADLFGLLTGNSLTACRWNGMSELVAYRIQPSPRDCALTNVNKFPVLVTESKGPLKFDKRCNSASSEVPQGFEKRDLELYCFGLKFSGGRVASGDEYQAVGNSLFTYFALPFRFVTISDNQAMAWVDFREYPWRDSFSRDVSRAAEWAGWTVDIAPCA